MKKTKLTRFLEELLSQPQSTLELVDVIGTTRPPNLATEARKKYQLDLPCSLVKYIKADGSKGKYGVYYLTADDREKVLKLLGGDK